jgi:hypothetical protein
VRKRGRELLRKRERESKRGEVCVRERERKSKRGEVCVREIEKERVCMKMERERERERERDRKKEMVYSDDCYAFAFIESDISPTFFHSPFAKTRVKSST